MYCTVDDLYEIFGEHNITKWADLDNDDNDSGVITSRIDRAIRHASNEVDSRLRHGIYTLPIASSTGSIPEDIIDVVATLAGVYLYENKGIDDFDPDTGRVVHRLIHSKKRAEGIIRSIQAGQRHINAVQRVYQVPR